MEMFVSLEKLGCDVQVEIKAGKIYSTRFKQDLLLGSDKLVMGKDRDSHRIVGSVCITEK